MYKNCKWIFLVFCILSVGCSYLQYTEPLLALKAVGASQAQIAKSVDLQERYFSKLIADTENGLLQVGINKSQIINTYGEPVLIKESLFKTAVEVLLYRYPTNFFKSDRIYLYFDGSARLVYWKHDKFKE